MWRFRAHWINHPGVAGAGQCEDESHAKAWREAAAVGSWCSEHTHCVVVGAGGLQSYLQLLSGGHLSLPAPHIVVNNFIHLDRGGGRDSKYI